MTQTIPNTELLPIKTTGGKQIILSEIVIEDGIITAATEVVENLSVELKVEIGDIVRIGSKSVYIEDFLQWLNDIGAFLKSES